jgi:hypothetical protein
MHLTFNEVRTIVKVAREKPDIATEDIISAVIDGYAPKSGIVSLVGKIKNNVQRIIDDEPVFTRPTTKYIFMICVEFHRESKDLVLSKTRKVGIVRIRQQYCLIAHLFKYSLSTIGAEINKDHATALWHKNKAIGFYHFEQYYRQDIKGIIDMFPKYKLILYDRLNNELQHNPNAYIKI